MKCLNMKLSIFAALVVGSLATDHLTYNMGGGGKGGGGKNGKSKSNGQASASNMGNSYNPMSPGNSEVKGNQGSVEVKAPSGAAKVHNVIVGGAAGLVYTPDTINAAVGDWVNFTFMMTNHTLTQSTFEKPCVKMPDGADSGFLPNPNNTIVPAPAFMFEVKTTAATWFYCKQRTGNHCGKGMVFSINPTAEKSHEMFKQLAVQQNGTAAANSSTVQSSTTTATDSASTTLPASTTDVQLAVSTTSANSPAATSGSGLAQGSGTGSDGGACSCTCLCGPGAFPAGAGVGNWGGYGGAMPAPWGTGQMPSPSAAAASGIAYR